MGPTPLSVRGTVLWLLRLFLHLCMEDAPVSSSGLHLALKINMEKVSGVMAGSLLMLAPLESPFFPDLLISRLQHQISHQASVRLTLGTFSPTPLPDPWAPLQP